MGFKVQAHKCGECLFTQNRIVSDKRAAQIIRKCAREDVHFECHKGTAIGQEIACRGFHEAFPHIGQLRRIAERLGMIEEVTVK